MVVVKVRIEEELIDRLDEHAKVPIAFRVERILAVSAPNSGLGGIVLSERPVERPWVKDYDAIKGEGPTRWPKRFDTSNWGLIAGHDADHRVGGAVIAFNTAGVNMLEGRPDTAVLWDLRVRPERRGSGVGSALFRAVEAWSLQRSRRTLKVETQNVNLAACRFYARVGCALAAIDTRAYPDLPEEAQLIWVKELVAVTP
jgi:GNAT superfamily N-acetyltransferase